MDYLQQLQVVSKKKRIMKKILLSLILVFPLLWISCDNIEDEDKLTFVPYITNLSTPITEVQDQQKVLLEDYTGWKCTNCARAAAKATELTNKYGEELVVMAVHSTLFAVPSATNGNIDFRTDYGEKWAIEFGCSALPTGLLNRNKFGAAYTVNDGNWDSQIQSLLDNSEHVMNINLGAEFRAVENKILVSTSTEFLRNFDTTTLINVVVVESGITGVQMNSLPEYGTTPKIVDFTFNHVLRKKAVIDYPLSSGNIASGTKFVNNYLLDIDTDIIDISKCKVIVFVTNSVTKQVLQVNEIHL